jgi:anthranilate phosphoribosyltransferase
MFAPNFHPAMKYATAPRREIGIRTVFNILGPLTNPAGAKAQVLGVAEGSLTMKMAQVLELLGCHHALVVHGEDGLDEITLSGHTTVCELQEGIITGYSLAPEDLGFRRADRESLRGGTAQDNADLLRRVLEGEKGPHCDIVLMNAAAALKAGDKAANLEEGVRIAAEAIDSGKALARLKRLIEISQSL